MPDCRWRPERRTETQSILHQAGAIAYRIDRGTIQVLLVTSRETGRWIIPKGNIDAGMTPAQAAKREAYEEAGVTGTLTSSIPLGVYTYFKKLKSGQERAAAVEVYLLHADNFDKKWPERKERLIAWMSTAEAIGRVEEPGVVPLLRRFAECEGSLSRDDNNRALQRRFGKHG